jgi:hypothetical protein
MLEWRIPLGKILDVKQENVAIASFNSSAEQCLGAYSIEYKKRRHIMRTYIMRTSIRSAVVETRWFTF